MVYLPPAALARYKAGATEGGGGGGGGGAEQHSEDQASAPEPPSLNRLGAVSALVAIGRWHWNLSAGCAAAFQVPPPVPSRRSEREWARRRSLPARAHGRSVANFWLRARIVHAGS